MLWVLSTWASSNALVHKNMQYFFLLANISPSKQELCLGPVHTGRQLLAEPVRPINWFRFHLHSIFRQLSATSPARLNGGLHRHSMYVCLWAKFCAPDGHISITPHCSPSKHSTHPTRSAEMLKSLTLLFNTVSGDFGNFSLGIWTQRNILCQNQSG